MSRHHPVWGPAMQAGFRLPLRRVKINETNNHAWKRFLQCRINNDRQFNLVCESMVWIKAVAQPRLAPQT
jgi:hypothetical protein